MKKKCVRSLSVLALTVLVIIGCGQQKAVETEIFDTEVSLQSSVETTSDIEEAINQTEIPLAEEDVLQSEFILGDDEFIVPLEENYVYHQMKNPSWEYYHENGAQELNAQTVFLEKLDEVSNGISDMNQWTSTYKLDFQKMPYSDEVYSYDVYGYNALEVYELFLGERYGEGREITLNFSDYNYANDFAEADRDYVFQRIIWAKVEDGILYVATGHYTYAESSPHNGYITAIDLADYHVIWKTAPLTCNSLSFEVIGDAIVCGYGFTAEDDFLYILDKKTGMVQETIPLKTAAEYIYQQDDILYVHTYASDLRFQIIEK